MAARLGCGALLTSDRLPSGRRGEGRRGEERGGREGYKLNRWRRRTIDGRADGETIRKKATQELHNFTVIHLSFEALPSNGCRGLCHVSGEQIFLNNVNSDILPHILSEPTIMNY